MLLGMKKRRVPVPAIVPLSDPDNALGKAYASVLRERAALLRTGLLLSGEVRQRIAEDLDALGRIAEMHPECFRGLR